MKSLKWLFLAIAVVIGVIVVAVYVSRRPRAEPGIPAPSVQPVPAAPVAAPEPERVPEVAPEMPAPPPEEAETRVEEEKPPVEVEAPEAPGVQEVEIPEGVSPEDVVQLTINEVLATVNGVNLLLGDLIPIRPGQGVTLMAKDEYTYRLNQAIERRLVSQAATEQGIALTDEQQQTVDAIRARHWADIEAARREGMMWTSVTREQIEFEANRAAAILLQQNLLAQAGAPSLQPTQEQVEAYYQAHKDELGELPDDPAQRDEAWQNIYMEIRRILDPQFQAEYLAWQEKYMEGLKSGANIVVNKPGL